ncbi:MAG: mononuclear molybdenum enzyme YedY [Chloroflexi bacterium RBG_16_54_11]|nr:MAG: mononuclear molybdenum enzyme YedY [Chloroflexi bacterium RBG_16_54_11]
MDKIDPSEITPRRLYLSRRQFIGSAGNIAIGALVLAACKGNVPTVATSRPTLVPTPSSPGATPSSVGPTDELGDPLTSYQDATHYNNYYEFSTNKQAVASLAANLPISPWSVEVSGLVSNPKTYSVEDLQKFQPEERIYRLRCVEAWSMVIPWFGFPLHKLLDEVQPAPGATFVKFTTLYDPKNLPGQNSTFLTWPYVEGLRMDEAMHDLTLIATGLYGEPLPRQDGAPVRLVVPWKYGFKSIKAIVKIELVDYQPASLWMLAAPNEYGFYANVNPNVDHPRWSQASERRIGEVGRRNTLLFNGYEKEVASLYSGMDLSKDF